MSHSLRLLVTGASGALGRLVVEALLERVEPSRVVAAVRDPAKLADFAARGVEVRAADYEQPATLAAAFAGIDRLLLISSNAVGQRLPQHANAIAAAKAAGVGLIAYTSILHADRSPLGLAAEHVQTEALLAESGVPFALLRNSWYLENYFSVIAPALEHGLVFGSAGEGRIAAASRADYAAAAAAVLTATEDQGGKIYELAGDDAFTMAEWAATLAEVGGKPVAYRDLPQADYAALLVQHGLPEGFAGLLADSDVGASKGGLFDDGGALARLIGRPTTTLKAALAAALKG
jgi:NAD(P)H dehydrogenase (quinone)